MTFSNKSGFSLLEIMVALGVAGLISLGTVTLIRNLNISSKTSDIALEVNAVSNSITQTLLNKEACANTFKSIGPIRDDMQINEIKNVHDKTIFDTTSKYGSNRVKISELKIGETTFTTPQAGSVKKYGEFTLSIVLEKLGKEFSGTKYSSKNLPLYAEFDLAGNLLKCYSSTEDTAITANKNFCEYIGGTWITATKLCNLSTQIGKHIALSTENLDAKLTDLLNLIEINYIKKTGDTMTGSLTINGANLNAVDVTANRSARATSSVCVGTKCRDFTLKQCNKDFFLVGITTDGSPICTRFLCPNNSYFEKLDPSTGNPICKPLPNKTCAANEYVSEVRPDGTVVCSPLPLEEERRCPQGQYVETIDPDGEITCENPNTNLDCAGNQFIYGFNNVGKALCRAMP